MFSARTFLATLALASTGAFAQLVNPITRPTVGDTLYAGGTFDILWTVTTPDELVSLILRQGPSNNIGVVGTIANDIQNTGSYEWDIPSNLASGNDYAIEIIVGPASNVSNVGPDGYNFTPLLPLVNNSTGPAVSGSASAASGNGSASVASATSAASATASGSAAASTTLTASTTTAASNSSGTTGSSETTTSGSSGTTTTSSSSTATATGKSAASRMDVMGGHAFIALGVAFVFGMVASF